MVIETWRDIHLLVEAESRRALSAGLRSLVIRIALRVNRLLMRSGKVWADRFHSRALTSPRAVRRALVYVLANFRKHGGMQAPAVDACSSATSFGGFRDRRASAVRCTSRPRTWLLHNGWKRYGLISVSEVPSS